MGVAKATTENKATAWRKKRAKTKAKSKGKKRTKK